MKIAQTFLLGLLGTSLSLTAAVAAPARHDHPAPRAAAPPPHVSAPRYVGVHVVPHYNAPMHPTNNKPHEVIVHNTVTNKDEHHVVVVDHRPAHVVSRDPHIRIVARGYHSPHNWGHWHVARGGWFRLWGINAWDTVGTVTCEAADETTGQLYPVTEDRDARGWDDDTVNSILDQALDDCMAEAGGAQCTPATPSCSFQDY
jgi:hypothetical protein